MSGGVWLGSVANVPDEMRRAWQDLEQGAPRVAGLGMASLTATSVALLGTLRRDGSPRISPVEPCLCEGQLLIGAMAWSPKAADLRRDPRYVLHSAVTGPDNGEGEFKVYGSAAEAGDKLRSAAAGVWWQDWPPGTAVVFALHVDRAVYVTWEIERGVMTIDRWSPRAGYSQSSRTYP